MSLHEINSSGSGNKDVPSKSKKAKSQSRFFAYFSFLLFLIVIVIDNLYPGLYNIGNVPVLLKNVTLASLFLLMFVLVISIPFYSSSPSSYIDFVLILATRLMWVSLIGLTISILYMYGVVSMLTTLFQKYLFPNLAEFTNRILATVFSWILSGITGNFFYDLLKKIAARLGNKNQGKNLV